MASPDRAQARRRLDQRFDQIRTLVGQPPPHRGWIRAIRDALGMSSAELAARLGVVQQSVADLERSEVHSTIKVETLRRVAEALDCDLVYALVPRKSLHDAVRLQAQRKAAAHLQPIAHHSRLEDQSVSEADTNAQLEELASMFIDHRGLWTETRSPS